MLWSECTFLVALNFGLFSKILIEKSSVLNHNRSVASNATILLRPEENPQMKITPNDGEEMMRRRLGKVLEGAPWEAVFSKKSLKRLTLHSDRIGGMGDVSLMFCQQISQIGLLKLMNGLTLPLTVGRPV